LPRPARPAPRLHLASRGHEVATSREPEAMGRWGERIGSHWGAIWEPSGAIGSRRDRGSGQAGQGRDSGFSQATTLPVLFAADPPAHHCRHQHSLMILRIDRPWPPHWRVVRPSGPARGPVGGPRQSAVAHVGRCHVALIAFLRRVGQTQHKRGCGLRAAGCWAAECH
jgi:hypothetical protein